MVARICIASAATSSSSASSRSSSSTVSSYSRPHSLCIAEASSAARPVRAARRSRCAPRRRPTWPTGRPSPAAPRQPRRAASPPPPRSPPPAPGRPGAPARPRGGTGGPRADRPARGEGVLGRPGGGLELGQFQPRRLELEGPVPVPDPLGDRGDASAGGTAHYVPIRQGKGKTDAAPPPLDATMRRSVQIPAKHSIISRATYSSLSDDRQRRCK
uniref:Uncharacterized protein n=1 Tax=Minutocellus polymorphus TaxID=265543 RepID=A0A7S0AF54_9STRA|mmetsp:Transcript_12166/g.20279  ORF Transcript_12166/g.20279 Transcript_12166/m.20279 type:complete len:215 (+) Transcript_12166:405-1049(+)